MDKIESYSELTVSTGSSFNQSKVIVIRGQRVMLDRDVAEALGVETRQLNENAKQSPKWEILRAEEIEQEYRMQPTRLELESLISKISTSSDFAKLPWFYTEKGCAHFATSLSSEEACRMAIRLSHAFTEMEAIKRVISGVPIDGVTASEFDAAAVIVSATLRIGELLGCPASLARAHAVCEVSRHLPGVNLRPLIAHNPTEDQELEVTPTQIAKELDLKSAREANRLLMDRGYQMKTASDEWEPTEKGRPFAIIHRLGKKHSNGTAVLQVKWFRSILKSLRADVAA